ncbi:MAG: class I SAM-dependent rRNA methyltransferase [Candidatus Magasanikbacteria bacterium]|nr:class I SAM-dependent rRNA methyltransferase [Candidatus Magasanikbacteria bacterium]
MINLKINKNRVGPILGRHPWVFQGAIKQTPEGLTSGMTVALFDETGRFLAQGYFNSYSQMAVRLWSWDEEEKIDLDFFIRRVRSAYELRKKYVESKQTDSYRLINSENDLLPGLIVDKYGDYLCAQFHNRGIEFWKLMVIDALEKVLEPKGIYERSDVGGRKDEEAGAKTGVISGDVPDRIKITENGFKFWVDVARGQKTGFFLDQRDKRAALQKYVDGKNVLNCFSYTGGFSVYALSAGAKKVVSVDSAEEALELAEENIKLNGLNPKKCEFICADVKDYLSGLGQKDPDIREDFEVIILDPPAFVKDRRKIAEGLQGYRKINEMAFRLLSSEGILVTASCSMHVSLQDFRYAVSEAAARARKNVQILETFTHGIDHPELVSFGEGEYLKCLFARVI